MTEMEYADYEWIIDDLKKSGLTIEDFLVIPLREQRELWDRLGFVYIDNNRILDVGGYWISYPNVPGYYRLKLKEKVGDIKYLSPKKEIGLGIHPYLLPCVFEALRDFKPDKPTIFTEGEKKACKATKEGFRTIGLSGVWCFKDDEDDFLSELEGLNFKYRKCFIAFDSDVNQKHNVRHAELRLAVEIVNREGIPFSVRLPNEPNGEKNGLDDYLVQHGKEKFQELLSQAKPTFELHLEERMPLELITKEIGRINLPIEREQTLKLIANYTKVSIEIIRGEAKKYQPKTDEKDDSSSSQSETFTEKETKDAEQLLKDPDILSRMVEITEKAGYVGEEINKKMLYLSSTSRLMDDSISIVVKGASSSGKSSLVQSVLRLIPKKDISSYSFVTAKSLVHSKADLSHKILFIQERHGAEQADYSIRTTLSEKELSILIPIKDETTGDFTSIEKRICAEGMVYIETTTQERIHNENETRVFNLFMDESSEQTARVLDAEAEDIKDKEKSENQLRVWRCAQTLLKPYDVQIPFAKELAKIFPKEKVRVRRDFKRFLTLIKTHTLLFQYQRETNENGKLIAALDDLKSILPLAEMVLSQSLKELSPKQEKVLEAIQKEFEGTKGFHLKDLHEKVKNIISYRTLQRYVEGFVKDGLLDWNGEKAKESMYSLSIPMTLCRKSIIFAPNFMESLENDLRQPHLTSNGVNDVNPSHSRNDDTIDDIDANSCQNDLSSINSNSDDELAKKIPIHVITTTKSEKVDTTENASNILSLYHGRRVKGITAPDPQTLRTGNNNPRITPETHSSTNHSDSCDCSTCCPDTDPWDKVEA